MELIKASIGTDATEQGGEWMKIFRLPMVISNHLIPLRITDTSRTPPFQFMLEYTQTIINSQLPERREFLHKVRLRN